MSTKKKSPPKYLYAVVWKETGEILLDHTDSLIVELTAMDARESTSGAPSGEFRVARYVLESSVRPGGK